MSWAVGFDSKWNRDIGYGVPAMCDHPGCEKEIDRGLAHVCADEQPYGGDDGCGLYFCDEHLVSTDKGYMCNPCAEGGDSFDPTPDVEQWVNHKATDPSWAEWREEQRGLAREGQSD